MPAITFDEKDLLRSRILPVAWYVVRVDTVSQKPSTSGNPNTNFVWPMSGTVIKNAENGLTEDESGPIAGVPTPPSWNFNDNPNAKGFILGFFKALGVDVKNAILNKQSLELKGSEGKELEIFIEQDTYDGRIVNRINHKYRKVGGNDAA